MGKPSAMASVPRIGEGKRGEAGHLGYLLRQASAAHRLKMERALADLAVTPPQFARKISMCDVTRMPRLAAARIAGVSSGTPGDLTITS